MKKIRYVSFAVALLAVSGTVAGISENCNAKVQLNNRVNIVSVNTGIAINALSESTQGAIIFADYFDSIEAGNSNETGGSSTPWTDGDYWFPAFGMVSAYQAGGAVRLGTSKHGGSITSKEIQFEGGSLIAEVSVKGWITVESNLIITVGEQTKTAAYTSTMSDEWETIKIKFDSVVANPTITLASGSKRCLIDSVVLMEADGTSESEEGDNSGTEEDREAVRVTKISFPKESYVSNKGAFINFSLDIEPSNATNKSVSFSSTDTCVAYVVDNKIYAVSEGSAIITATAQDGSNISGSCIVTVNETAMEIPYKLLMYYASINGLKKEQLKIALGKLLKNHEKRTYDDLKTDYKSVYVVPGTKEQVWDIFSDEKYNYSSGSWNREHVVSNSWWGGTKNNAYSDLFNVLPAESTAANHISNFPPSELTNNVKYDHGRIKVGTPKSGMGGSYSWAFEPYDEFKGDFARIYFYVATCYDDIAWGSGNVDSEINRNTWPTLEPWLYQMLVRWHNLDPVSDMERQINNTVEKIQGNRNPFIDFPVLVDLIWNEDYFNIAFNLDNATLYQHIDGSVTIGGDDGDNEEDDSEGSTGETNIIASGNCGENATWKLSSDSVLTISGSGKMKDYTDYYSDSYYTAPVPWYSYNNIIKTVKIDNGITSIGSYAFDGCINMTSVSIPISLTCIAQYAFSRCKSISSITIPNSVTSIGDNAFYGCSGVSSLNWDSNVSPYCLTWCCKNNLKTVVLGENITSIGTNAFKDCSGLTSVSIGNSVTNIESSAFSGCCSLKSITIPNSVISLGGYAFDGCSGLTSVTIGNSVTGIGYNAFSGCSSLTSIEIPNSVTSIGSYAFSGCSNLTSVTIPNSVKNIDRSVFRNCSSLTSVAIPNSVTSIEYQAFYGCSGLTSIEIPNSVTSIAGYAFDGCSGVTSITWGSNVSPYCLTQYCKNKLKTVVLGDDITSIGNKAFSGCSGLTSIEMPNSVSSIENNAFEGCNNIESLYWNSNVSPYCLTRYCNKTLKSVEFGDNITVIGNSALSGCSSLASINIPNSVISIGNNAFEDCSGLTSIEIPNSVTEIGYSAFSGCSSLTSIEIPNSVTDIGSNAFKNCRSLTTVSISNSVSSIEDYTFYGCKCLTSIALPNSITSIGKYAFGSCGGMTSIIIPNSVTSINDYAFEGCSGLKSIEISANIQEVGTHAFDGCNVLECARLEIGQLYAKYKTNTIFTSSAGIKVKINDSEANAADGIIIVKDKPNTYFSGPCKVYCNGTLIYQSNNVSFTTKSLLPNLNYESNPTQIIISSVSYVEEDAKVVKTEVWNPITGEFVTGGALQLTNLTPNSSYYIPYRVYYGTGKDDYEGGSTYVDTYSLTLKTEIPKVVNSTSAVVAATTNIPDDEVSVGFEWRKIDAPEEIPSKSGGAVIYNGRMEGKIMNLQTDSYYKVRAYYESREGKKYYGEWVGFDPSDFSYFEPTVHTYAMASAQTSNSVKVRGYAVAGTDDLDEQGFEYSEVGSSAEPKRVSATGQLMTATLEGLKYNTSYNVRAYVKTSSKTVYGETVTFKTPDIDAIEEITVDAVQERTIQGVYDMQGRLISRDSNIDLSTLKQGIYIVNGKKVLIK